MAGIAGEHDDRFVHCLKAGNGFRCLTADHILHRQQSCQPPVCLHIQGCLPFRFKLFCSSFIKFRYIKITQHAPFPNQTRDTIDHSADTKPGHILHRLGRFVRNAPRIGILYYRTGNRMPGQLFQRSRYSQQLSFRYALCRAYIGNLRFTLGQGSGFVKDHCLNTADSLQMDSPLEQYAFTRGIGDSGENSRHNGGHQGTGRSNHEEDHCPVDGILPRPVQQIRR
ncbi:hypothetical protein D3C80_1309910 [compost metagenome]